MQTVAAHYDGSVLVPHGAVDLAIGEEVELQLVRKGPPAAEEPRNHASQFEEVPRLKPRTLLEAVRMIEEEHARAGLPDDLPSDYAAQYKHYLYGTPKQP